VRVIIRMRALAIAAGAAALLVASRDPLRAQASPLPFDTTGARRGIPPNSVAIAPYVKLLGGDTLLWARLTFLDWTPPARIELSANATDTTTERRADRAIDLAKCPFDLTVYVPSVRGAAPVWDSRRASPRIACPLVEHYRPGDSHARFSVADIVGDSLSGRKYHVRYGVLLASGRRVQYDGGELFLAREPLPRTRDRAALQFTSTSEISGATPRALVSAVTVRNTGRAAVQVAYGACALHTRLWRSPDRSGPPAWRSEERRPILRRGDTTRFFGYGCPMYLVSGAIKPNDTLHFSERIPIPEILATMPEGHYWVGVDLKLLNDSLRPPQWEAHYTMSAGDVTITRSPDPPPAVRQHGALRIEAATRLVRGATRAADSVKTFVLLTNTGDDTASVTTFSETPVSVYGFRSAEERDEYPMPKPLYETPFVPARQASGRLTLGAGEKWLFERAMSVRDVVARVGKGRLYFMASLQADPRTELLSAGDVDLEP